MTRPVFGEATLRRRSRADRDHRPVPRDAFRLGSICQLCGYPIVRVTRRWPVGATYWRHLPSRIVVDGEGRPLA